MTYLKYYMQSERDMQTGKVMSVVLRFFVRRKAAGIWEPGACHMAVLSV